MEQIDVILYPLIPILIILHLLVAPYTKVEESFNIQAMHDISNYGIPFQNISASLRQNYDHFSFPGSVPRTFVGALSTVGIAQPIIHFAGTQYAQLIVRGVLGIFNGIALLKFKAALQNAFGKDVGRWYILLQASQFHIIYYASRTLPNMFALGLTTLAFTQFLPAQRPLKKAAIQKKQKLAIFTLVFSGVVFRSEIAILLFSQLAYLLVQSSITIQTTLKYGIISALVALAISVPIDSYFWQYPVWPELSGFYYNAIQGKSSDWGTSPFYYYFTSCLPRLLVNPLTLVLIPVSNLLPSTRNAARNLTIPHLTFIGIYSLQPHKEPRFIFYSIPTLTAAGALSASHIWKRRSKSIFYVLGSIILLTSVAASFAASLAMLLISSLNYPGGNALSSLHTHLGKQAWPTTRTGHQTVKVHLDVLTCMTGATHFQEFPWRGISPDKVPIANDEPVQILYDKTEVAEELLKPEFWAQFDYLLMEDPTKAIGAWEVVDSVYAYAGIEFLRPGDGSSFSENLERVYAANNITKTEGDLEKAPSSDEVKEAMEEGKGIDDEFRSKEDERGERARLLLQELGSFGTYRLIRDAVRQVTGGYWIGPRMEPKIRILRKLEDPISI